MSEELFRVVFDGSLTGEVSKDVAMEKFARLFRLDEKRARMLFSGKEYVIKNNISESVAMEFLIKLSETGCECIVEQIPDKDDFYDGDEKRKLGERRLRYRRGPRAGAIVPDRRLKIRRLKDRKYYTDLKEAHHEMPLAFQTYPADAINVSGTNG